MATNQGKRMIFAYVEDKRTYYVVFPDGKMLQMDLPTALRFSLDLSASVSASIEQVCQSGDAPLAEMEAMSAAIRAHEETQEQHAERMRAPEVLPPCPQCGGAVDRAEAHAVTMKRVDVPVAKCTRCDWQMVLTGTVGDYAAIARARANAAAGSQEAE